MCRLCREGIVQSANHNPHLNAATEETTQSFSLPWGGRDSTRHEITKNTNLPKEKKGNHWNNRTEKLRMLQIKLYFLSFRFWNQRAYSRLAVVISSASPACSICVFFCCFFLFFLVKQKSWKRSALLRQTPKRSSQTLGTRMMSL